MTYQANLLAANAKARLLNNVLPELQEEFEAKLTEGVIMELAPGQANDMAVAVLEEILAAAAA